MDNELCNVIVVNCRSNKVYNDDYDYDYDFENTKIYGEEKIWKLERDDFETVRKNIHRYYEIQFIEILDEESISSLMEEFADFSEKEKNREKQREQARARRQKQKDEKILKEIKERGLIDVG